MAQQFNECAPDMFISCPMNEATEAMISGQPRQPRPSQGSHANRGHFMSLSPEPLKTPVHGATTRNHLRVGLYARWYSPHCDVPALQGLIPASAAGARGARRRWTLDSSTHAAAAIMTSTSTSQNSSNTPAPSVSIQPRRARACLNSYRDIIVSATLAAADSSTLSKNGLPRRSKASDQKIFPCRVPTPKVSTE